jgi:hypothetical protein
MAKYTGQVIHDDHPSFIVYWMNFMLPARRTNFAEVAGPTFKFDSETKGCECQFMKLQHWVQSLDIKVLWDIPDDRRPTQIVNPLWQM